MKQPLYVTLRAISQGAIIGSVVSIFIGLLALCQSVELLIALALLVGPVLFGISHLLDRRAIRNARKSESKGASSVMPRKDEA